MSSHTPSEPMEGPVDPEYPDDPSQYDRPGRLGTEEHGPCVIWQGELTYHSWDFSDDIPDKFWFPGLEINHCDNGWRIFKTFRKPRAGYQAEKKIEQPTERDLRKPFETAEAAIGRAEDILKDDHHYRAFEQESVTTPRGLVVLDGTDALFSDGPITVENSIGETWQVALGDEPAPTDGTAEQDAGAEGSTQATLTDW